MEVIIAWYTKVWLLTVIKKKKSEKSVSVIRNIRVCVTGRELPIPAMSVSLLVSVSDFTNLCKLRFKLPMVYDQSMCLMQTCNGLNTNTILSVSLFNHT